MQFGDTVVGKGPKTLGNSGRVQCRLLLFRCIVDMLGNRRAQGESSAVMYDVVPRTEDFNVILELQRRVACSSALGQNQFGKHHAPGISNAIHTFTPESMSPSGSTERHIHVMRMSFYKVSSSLTSSTEPLHWSAEQRCDSVTVSLHSGILNPNRFKTSNKNIRVPKPTGLFLSQRARSRSKDRS